jgi:hypothetical protein
VEFILGPLDTAATPGLLYLPRVIVRMEKLVEWRVAGEKEVLAENLPRRHFIHHKSHLPDPGAYPGRRGGKPVTNRFSYGAAKDSVVGIPTGYGLDARRVGVRVPVGARIFSSRPDRLWVHPTYPMGTGGSFARGVKRQGRQADHSPRTSAEVKKIWIYTSTSPYTFMA